MSPRNQNRESVNFSIITINYNNCAGLRQTITSVIDQSYHNYEYIVIDGGSNDGSKEAILEFSDRIDYWVSEPDNGIYNAMNKGIDAAHGECLLFLNSGDVLHNDMVLEALAREDMSVDILIGKVSYVNTGEISSLPECLTMNHFYSRSIPHPATIMKRTIFDSLRYDESYKIVSDWKLFIEIIIMGNASYAYTDIIVANFDSGGISSVNKALVDAERMDVLSSMFPPRVLDDYIRFNSGEGYKTGDYDAFFIKLRSYKYGSAIYTIAVVLMRLVALFRPGASFAKNYPIFLK